RARTMNRINVGVVGIGGWGKNLARNYSQIPEARLRYMCDVDERRLEALQIQLRADRTTQNFEELLEDPALDAVVIATPGPTHYDLCKQALLAGKDVYV